MVVEVKSMSPTASLTATNVRVGCETDQGVDIDQTAGPPGDVVNHHRATHVGDCGEMGNETVLGGLVVIRSDSKNTIGSEFGCALGEGDRMCGVIRACARDDLGLLGRHCVYHRLEQGNLLGVVEGGRLTGGSGDHDRVGSLFCQMSSEIPCFLVIDRP